HDEYVIGEEKYLKELFENALEWKIERPTDSTARITVKNNSELRFRLKKTQHDTRLLYFRETTIVPHGEHTFIVRLRDGIQGGDINFVVENFFVRPNEGMRYTVKM
ncbi:MAG: Sb-PDE family phosphodiesterase, partial [Bacteroidales bacterium]|nr:Sb-PDE family phosphodiesterase [Bacteroidales bacterium]